MYNLCINPVKSNSISFKGGKVAAGENILSKTIKGSLNMLHSRAEREVAEYDYFKPVQVIFENSDKSLYAGDVKLVILQVPKDKGVIYKTKRSLEAFVYSPTKGQNVSRVISQGTKKEILQKLKDEKLANELEDFIKESSTMLIEDGY
jgi:hypothetical protein